MTSPKTPLKTSLPPQHRTLPLPHGEPWRQRDAIQASLIPKWGWATAPELEALMRQHQSEPQRDLLTRFAAARSLPAQQLRSLRRQVALQIVRGQAPQHRSRPGLEVVERLARGTRGLTLRAKRRGEKGQVVVKYKRLRGLLNGAQRTEYLSRLRRIAAIRSKRVLSAEVLSQNSDELVLRRPYLDALSVPEFTQQAPVSARRVALIVSRLARSLAVLHSHGLSHGSLTPNNIFIDAHDHVVITDPAPCHSSPRLDLVALGRCLLGLLGEEPCTSELRRRLQGIAWRCVAARSEQDQLCAASVAAQLETCLYLDKRPAKPRSLWSRLFR